MYSKKRYTDARQCHNAHIISMYIMHSTTWAPWNVAFKSIMVQTAQNKTKTNKQTKPTQLNSHDCVITIYSWRLVKLVMINLQIRPTKVHWLIDWLIFIVRFIYTDVHRIQYTHSHACTHTHTHTRVHTHIYAISRMLFGLSAYIITNTIHMYSGITSGS